MGIGGYCKRVMTGPRQMLLELICYASDRGKPAVLNVRPEKIMELCMRGLIEQREDGYWITELGRGQCPQQYIPGQDLRSSANVRELWQVHEIPPRLVPTRAARRSQHVSGDLSAVWRRLVNLGSNAARDLEFMATGLAVRVLGQYIFYIYFARGHVTWQQF